MFVDRLKDLSTRIEGVQALSLVARDGMQVETVAVRDDLDLDALAAELLTQVRAITQNHQELSVGEVQHLSVHTDRLILMVTAIAQEYFLMLVLDSSANTGKARFELRRARLLFEDEF